MGPGGLWWGRWVEPRARGRGRCYSSEPLGRRNLRAGARVTEEPSGILEARSGPGGPGARGTGARESRAEGSRARSSGVKGLGPHRVARARFRQQPRQVLHQVPLFLDLLRGLGESERPVTSGAFTPEPAGTSSRPRSCTYEIRRAGSPAPPLPRPCPAPPKPRPTQRPRPTPP